MSDAATLAAATHKVAADVSIQAGLIDWAEQTAVDIRPILQTVALTVAVLFVIYKAVHSKFSFGTIVVSALAAGVFVWAVFNVDSLSDTIGEDLPGDGTSVTDDDGGGDGGGGSDDTAGAD